MAKKTGKAVSVRSEKRERMAAYAKAAKGSAGSIVGKLLRFSKGEYLAGQDDEEIEIGTRMVLNLDSVLVGWTRWEDNKPVEQDMGPIIDAFQPKPRSQLGFTDQSEWEVDNEGKSRDPWAFGNQMLLKTVGKGAELFTYTTGSKGGLQAMGRLLENAMDDDSSEDNYPIIELDTDFYMHPKYKKVYVPDWKIVGWQPITDWEIKEAAPASKKAAAKTKPAPAKVSNTSKGRQKALSY